jgi:hypothetical protein
MKLLLAAVAGAVAMLAAQPAAAADPPFPINPWPGPNVKYAFAVDTLTGTGGRLSGATGTCVGQSVFRRGNAIVFQAIAVRTKDGKVMTGKDISRMVVRVPGQPDQKMVYRPLGSRPDATSPWVWVVKWIVPDDYPLGSLAYEVVGVTKKTRAQKGGIVARWKPRFNLTITP